jgi:hypothetical protein
MEVQMWPMKKVIFYARNPRKNEAAVHPIMASFKKFAFTISVLARSDGEVVDGHLRLKAAWKLALEQVPPIVCDERSAAQMKLFRLLMNGAVSWADWDDIDLRSTGFKPNEIDTLLGIRRQGRGRIGTYAVLGEVCDAAA